MGETNLLTLKIDGREVRVPPGTNLIEAAASIGIEIPHYCYHKCLSIAGNCRMCQVKLKGQDKLVIACNTTAQEGMEVFTHNSSNEVSEAQTAILEFILVNHPMDCTICDQAGHCKLQDYYYQYSSRLSRFEEEKEHKVKGIELGPHVILDGERCIMCTRCIRFCDEITKTSELGMINRGDRSVIAVNPGKVLDNPLSGTVVDLCPVGALTHRDWRFNTRIWFTNQTDSICPGCSTGCNVKVAEREGQVVGVKARFNEDVNKEWLCDEGRYGFGRILPKQRILKALINARTTEVEEGLLAIKGMLNGYTGIFVSPDLTLEEYEILRRFLTRYHKGHFNLVLGYRSRELDEVQSLLMSPDCAANFRGAEFVGIVKGDLEKQYLESLDKLRKGVFKNILIIGDRGIFSTDVDESVLQGMSRADYSIGFLTNLESDFSKALKALFPARSILEKSGLMINSKDRLQYLNAVVPNPDGTHPHWKLINMLAKICGDSISEAISDRDLTLWYLEMERRLGSLTIAGIKAGGVQLNVK
ncbi:MAG: 2Fe-2S iron-sulfur cluster binding domain-containing protein [SAR324 cluster bacterium]|uniref:2Fe-2S iron-sulfur cluster binding domain-containing protein n=1 Tax=SAR324 cluster bacterium TaxID=2024889 RepID=A0A7X9FRG1_9DELT|nr:2Fe-2S iron-sulfur cluster binding domain-containing protein [SAR324 cluster bacterium]